MPPYTELSSDEAWLSFHSVQWQTTNTTKVSSLDHTCTKTTFGL